jgi:mannitol/fructose-specific phosphotransferase system IIA component
MSLSPDLSEEFDRFWKACPRKTNKAAARKAFPKALKKGVTTDQLIEDMSRRVELGQWSLSEKRFIPHPATYLNGERWEDEIVTRRKVTTDEAIADRTRDMLRLIDGGMV